MTPLALQRLVAFPFQSQIEPREAFKRIISNQDPRPRPEQQVPGRQVLAQIYRDVETISREPVFQRVKVSLGQFGLAQFGTGMEELKRNAVID